jgi:anti-anti-sigma factor
MDKIQNGLDILSIKRKLADNELFRDANLSILNFDHLKLNAIRLKKGEKLFREKDPANSIYLIIEGEIKLIKKNFLGKNHSLLIKDSFFGHEEYFLQTTRKSTVISVKDSCIIELSKDSIEILCRDSSILNNIRNSMPDLDSESKTKFEKAAGELSGTADNLLSAFPAELKKENDGDSAEDNNYVQPSGNPGSSIDVVELHSGINKIVNNIRESLSHLDEEKHKLLALVSDYETNNKKLLDEIEEMKKRERGLIILDKEKNEVLGSQSYRIIELEKEITRFIEIDLENSKKIELLSEQETKFKNSITKLEEGIKEKEAAISKFGNDIKERETIISKLKNNLSEKEAIVTKFEKDLYENQKTVSDLNEAQLMLMQKADDQGKILKEQKSELENFGQKIETLSSALALKERSLAELNKDLLNKSNEISKQNDYLNKIEVEIGKFRESLENKDALIQNLSTKNEELQKELDNRKIDEKNKDELILSQDGKIAEYEKSLNYYKNELSEKEKYINNFMEEITELSERVWQKQIEINDQNEIISEFENEIAALKKSSENPAMKNNKHRSRNLELKQNAILKLSDELNKFKSDIETYKNTIKEKDNIIEKKEEESENWELTKSELIKLIHSSKSSYEEEIKKKDNQIAELIIKVESLQKTLEEKISLANSQIEAIKSEVEMIGGPEEFVNELKINPDIQINAKNYGTLKDVRTEKKQLYSILNIEIFSKCKLIEYASAYSAVNDRSFEHFQYSSMDIVNVNLPRVTMEVAQVFNKFLNKIISRERNKIVVNLPVCEYMDSSILGVLINNLKRAMSFKGGLVLVLYDQNENSLFSLTMMNKIFQIFHNLKDALNSFS